MKEAVRKLLAMQRSPRFEQQGTIFRSWTRFVSVTWGERAS